MPDLFFKNLGTRDRVWLAGLLGCFAIQSNAAEIDFNRDIRPILSENCFYCHGQDGAKRKAGLRLDQRAGALSSKAFVPGNARKSELVLRILSDDPDEQMPPPGSNRLLSDEEKALLQEWIDQGAEYAEHWAFVPPERPELPEVRDLNWVRNPIDYFVAEQLDARDLEASGEADRFVLIKRLYSDLVGLAPTPREIDDFVSDPDPEAYERLVDRLLASRHYGERLALPWLDAARYADSNGFQQDGDTWQWVWRDWVVRALNEDLPFDAFTTWQLAGDLLPNPTTDQLVASGFNRNHLSNGEGGNIAEEQRFVVLFDRVDTTATTWLGLTMACAQCHDHKYDPITQKDYYQFLDAFNHVSERGVPSRQSVKTRVSPPFIELPSEENRRVIAEFESKISRLEDEVKAIKEEQFRSWSQSVDPNSEGLTPALSQLIRSNQRTAEEEKELAKLLRQDFNQKIWPARDDDVAEVKQLTAVRKELLAYKGDHVPMPMVMNDERRRQTHILDRGAYLNKLEPVSFETPAFLPPQKENEPRNRLGLARWLLDPGHPLTARVQVNRMWQYFFGLGLVKTSEDFGVQGEYPLHMDLLDWLATEFIRQGWSMKRMHRLIVTSATYRQDSRMNDWHRENDPANRFLSRGARFRMPAMVLRDWALSSSGLLDASIGGKPVYPYLPKNPWETLAQVTKERDFSYPASHGSGLYRRSLYTFWRRTVTPSNMFDASSRQACRVAECRSNTPLHALTTLNDPTWVEASRALAQQVGKASRDFSEQLTLAFRRVAGRTPSTEDLEILERAYQKQLTFYQSDPPAAVEFLSVGEFRLSREAMTPELAALAATCLAIYNLDESLTRL